MGVSARRRAWPFVVLFVACSIAAAGWWLGSRPGELIEVIVFDAQDSWCAAAQQQPFTRDVDALERTSPDALRLQTSSMVAGSYRTLSARPSTGASVEAELVALARDLDRAATTGDFGPARAAAKALDERARRECR